MRLYIAESRGVIPFQVPHLTVMQQHETHAFIHGRRTHGDDSNPTPASLRGKLQLIDLGLGCGVATHTFSQLLRPWPFFARQCRKVSKKQQNTVDCYTRIRVEGQVHKEADPQTYLLHIYTYRCSRFTQPLTKNAVAAMIALFCSHRSVSWTI